ncbi:MAG: hypothetical protein ACOVLE_04175 [Pirellula staleyi]
MAVTQNIILVEDDPTQAQWLAEDILWKIDPGFSIRYFDSEHSIKAALDKNEFKDWNPNHAIVDLLVRYYSPQDLEEPEVDATSHKEEIAEEAGIRIRNAIKQKFRDTKIAIVTVMDGQPAGGLVIQKGSDNLYNKLERFLSS